MSITNRVAGSTVYILGAGASRHAGAPLLGDFLVTARLLRESQPDLVFHESFDRVFEWLDSLRGSSYYVEFDLDNMEHVFSLADMSRQLGIDDAESMCQDLKRVIAITLDYCQVRYKNNSCSTDSVYSEFVELLQRLDLARRKWTQDPARDFRQDTLITFNYDVLLDHVFASQFNPMIYGLSDDPIPPPAFPLLKLHGSVNWYRCEACDSAIVTLRPTPFSSPSNEVRRSEYIPFGIAGQNMISGTCSGCKRTGTLIPEIVAPTWSKSISNGSLASVWRRAVQSLREAFQLVVIGYSMPPTDTFFQYLLTLGLKDNPSLHRVIVVNPDGSESFRDRYSRVFSRSLADRGKLVFLEPMGFHEFLGSYRGNSSLLGFVASRLDIAEVR